MQLRPPARPAARLSWTGLAAEPFRVYFPLAIAAGVLGVSLWPLHFLGLGEYPGVNHARLMAHGFFGGFIVGFLGTALPRMLGTRSLGVSLVTAMTGLHLGVLGLHLLGRTAAADTAFLAELLVLAGGIAARFPRRADLPPPGFVLAGMGLVCAIAGACLGWRPVDDESDAGRAILQSRLLYQGFLLLPALGVGGFLFPGLLGAANRQDLPPARRPGAGWWRGAGEALAAGLLIVASFGVELAGQMTWAHALRFATAAVYLGRQIPLGRAHGRRSPVSRGLRVGIGLLLAGLLAVALLPAWRVAMLHLTFASGLTLVTLTVATRVLFGHSGQRERLHARNLWLVIAFGLMVSATLTRITGDFLPKILPTHYSYGALMWAAGALLWAWKALPAILVADPEP